MNVDTSPEALAELRMYAGGYSAPDVIKALCDALEEARAPDWPTMTQLVRNNDALRAQLEEARAALERINQWSQAYPLEVFPEPDLKLARQLLEEGGITLDAVSASAMRRVVEGVGKIARDALK